MQFKGKTLGFQIVSVFESVTKCFSPALIVICGFWKITETFCLAFITDTIFEERGEIFLVHKG